jgi:hypothetical protein
VENIQACAWTASAVVEAYIARAASHKLPHSHGGYVHALLITLSAFRGRSETGANFRNEYGSIRPRGHRGCEHAGRRIFRERPFEGAVARRADQRRGLMYVPSLPPKFLPLLFLYSLETRERICVYMVLTMRGKSLG